MQIRRILVKKGQWANLYQTKKIQNIVKNIFQNKIEQIKKNANLLQNILVQAKRKKRLFEKGLKKIAKMQNLSQNEFNQITEMSGQSLDELDRITKTRRIKNYEEMTEELISLLKSKQSIAELFNNNSNNNNNNNNDNKNNNNNNLYDNKISDIRRILNRLRDVLPQKYRKEIKEKLSEIKQENLSEVEKEENDEDLRKLGRILNDKEKHSPYDCDDFDYYGIRDIQNLFDKVSEEDYYKPILVKSFKVNYKYYESRGHKEKRLSVRQYLNKITLQLYDLIKDCRVAKRVWKFKYLCALILFLLRILEKLTLFMYGVIMQALCGVVIQMILLENFLGLLHNYQEELKIAKGSDFVFESVELMDYKLHGVRLRRGGSYI